MCATQRVGDQRRFGVRRRGDPHGQQARPVVRTAHLTCRVGARQPPRDRGDGVGDDRRATQRSGEDDGGLVATQQRRVGAAVTEDRLVGIPRDDGELGTGRQHANQPGRLRIEMLRVVDEEQLDPAALGSQQVRIGGECLERGTDEFGGAQRGHGGLRRRHPHRGAQQHDLLIGLGELPGGQPFGPAELPPDALQRNGIHATFGAAGQQVTEFVGEPDGAQRLPQLGGPRHR